MVLILVLKLLINYSDSAPYEGAILVFNNTTYLLDYSDSPKLLNNHNNYDFYFKRSLLVENLTKTTLPLNFQVNFSINPLSLIRKMDKRILKNPTSKTEIIRALDYFSFFVNDSHFSKRISKISREINDNNGRIIYLSRLWSPDNTQNLLEKERRIKQNEFRINACWIFRSKLTPLGTLKLQVFL